MTPQARSKLSALLRQSAEVAIIALGTSLVLLWTVDLANRFFAGF